jgi:hypothetical protein
MGGSGDDAMIPQQMTFNCIDDLESVKNIIIENIALYIEKFIKKRYQITMNPILVVIDFKNDLNLLEDLIYPLVYTRRYTMQGINYFTDQMLRDKVYYNLKINNVIYTTLIRRGIDVLPINEEDI